MARIRTIKPEFWEDEDIGSLSRDARLLFIASWNLADDEGLLRWTAAYIKASVFMYDDDITEPDCARIMTELEGSGQLFPYKGGRAGVQRLACVVNFRRHQRINRPQPGRLPPPSLQSQAVMIMYARRDRWTCGICQLPVEPDPVKRHKTKKVQPSLDHIQPRSEGGDDYPSNIRLAHFSCNASRGNRSVNHSPSEYVTGVHGSPPEVELGSGSGSGSGSGNGDQGTWEVKLPPEPATPRRIGKPVDPGVKAAAAAWKAQLVAQGVTMLPQDWSLKACAVVAKALRAGLTPADLEDAFEWGREQAWFADKLHDPAKLGDLIAQWQQRKVKALATTNGQSKHRLDQHYARLREASREN